MNNISGIRFSSPINFKSKSEGVENTKLLEEEAPADSFEQKSEPKEITKEDRQKIIKKAKCKASCWSTGFLGYSTLYYGLRPNKMIAKEYNLNVDKDKTFIRQIRNEETMSTLPGAMVPIVGGLVNWYHHEHKDSSKYDV